MRKKLLRMVTSVSPKHKGKGRDDDAAGEDFVYHDSIHHAGREGEREALVMVHINISQYKLGVDWQNPCSLEKLGIIPNRYGLVDQSLNYNSLRLKSLKSRNRSAEHVPVIVRGVVPSSPAALTGRLEAGEVIVIS